jgi:hypothetical protein
MAQMKSLISDIQAVKLVMIAVVWEEHTASIFRTGVTGYSVMIRNFGAYNPLPLPGRPSEVKCGITLEY